jgi:hypothetical protein
LFSEDGVEEYGDTLSQYFWHGAKLEYTLHGGQTSSYHGENWGSQIDGVEMVLADTMMFQMASGRPVMKLLMDDLNSVSAV